MNVDADLGGAPRRLGRLRSIPVMIGGGPSYRRGPTKVGVSLVAGIAFDKFTIDEGTRTTLQGLGQTLSSVEMNDDFAARIGTSVWHDLSTRIGLHASLGYLYHRPTAKTTINGVTTSEKWKTDKVKLQAGFAVGIF